MFQRILVVLDDAHPERCIFNTAWAYAKANQAHLRWIVRTQPHTTAQAQTAIPIEEWTEFTESIEQTETALLDIAQAWSADLVILGSGIALSLTERLSCSVLVVQQQSDQTISMTLLQRRSRIEETELRNQLERLLDLTPNPLNQPRS